MNPISYLVFHGGSGSLAEEIKTAVDNGVVKMNVDTDTQYAYLVGIRVSLSSGETLTNIQIKINFLYSGLH